jgi:hypothetical protein
MTDVRGKDIVFVFNGPSLSTVDTDPDFKELVNSGVVLVGTSNCYPAFKMLRGLGAKLDFLSVYAYWDVSFTRPFLPADKIDDIVNSGARIICPILSHKNNDWPVELRERYKDIFVELEPDVNRDNQHLMETTLVKLICFFSHLKANRIFLFGCDGYTQKYNAHYNETDEYIQKCNNTKDWYSSDRERINREWVGISKEWNITIPVFNVTTGSKIDVFPKITLKECLEMVNAKG